MAAPKQAARVEVISPTGERGTVAPEDVQHLPDGARVVTAQELAQERVQKQYEGRSLAEKAIAYGITGDITPEMGAYREAAHSTASAGVLPAATRAALDTVGPAGAGAKYAERVDDLGTAYPGSSTAGSVAGFLGGTAITMATGGASGVAGALGRATPMGALSAAGAPVEAAVARGLGGLAAKGTLGRAAQQGAAMAVRGAVEGAAYSGIEQAASDVLHDEHTTGAKLYSAGTSGAVMGAGIGAALGVAGSLIGTGLQRLRASRPTLALEEGTVPPMMGARGAEVPFIDANAGLRGGPGAAERPFTIGAERRPAQLRPGGRPRVEIEEPISLTGGVSIDPDAGIAARNTSGRFQGKAPKTEGALRLSSAKQVPHDIDVRLNESLDALASTSPIKMPAPTDPVAAVSRDARQMLGGMLDAGEQAWRAVGGGFGLQSTRYAKEAAKHFGSTAELGNVALKHGLIDTGTEGKSAISAAWQAAKSGTPADILPRAHLATETVGRKLGELTEASGARVAIDDAVAAANTVADSYSKQAGRRGLVNAAREYGDDLRSVLRPGADGKVSVQELLEQRKILDDIVFEETKTLDPKGRVKALRDVRGKLENTIATALDEASGRMPGELRSEYNALKRDYHGLRILSEAAEDSAARAAKGSTFGLGEKFALGSAVAGAIVSGNPIGALAGPALAVGGKLIRERGNAAAAAYLSRATVQGSFDSAVRAFNRRLEHAAVGVLSAGDKSTPSTSRVASEPARRLPSTTPVASRAAVRASREHERQVQTQADQIVKWVGDLNANPERVTRQVEEAAAEIAQAIGPKAAEGYSASTMRAIAFISGYIPIKERRDPLDPRSVPPLMRDEATRLVRATKYALRPETIFEDFGRGVITPEGLRAAKFIDPDSFEEFQLKLQDHVENHMLRNRQLTQSQRLRIDKLLGYPAGADLRPKSIARRQANFDVAMNDPSGSPAEAPPTGNGPVNMNTQQSGFDAIESRMAG